MKDATVPEAGIQRQMRELSKVRLVSSDLGYIARKLAGWGGVQTEPLRTAPGSAPQTFGKDVWITSWPWDGWYVSQAWEPAHASMYPYTAPHVAEFTGNGLNNHAFPDLTSQKILSLLEAQKSVFVSEFVWMCGVVQAVDVMCRSRIAKDKGLSGDGAINTLANTAKDQVGKIGAKLLKDFLAGDKTDPKAVAADALSVVIADVWNWLKSSFFEEFKEHDGAVQLQKRVLNVARGIFPGECKIFTRIDPAYRMGIGKKKAGSWTGYEPVLTGWGQAASHDTLVGLVAQKEYEGVYSCPWVDVCAGFFSDGKLFLNFDDDDNALSLENVKAAFKARDAYAGEIGHWRNYRPGTGYGVTPYDGSAIKTVWRE